MHVGEGLHRLHFRKTPSAFFSKRPHQFAQTSQLNCRTPPKISVPLLNIPAVLPSFPVSFCALLSSCHSPPCPQEHFSGPGKKSSVLDPLKTDQPAQPMLSTSLCVSLHSPVRNEPQQQQQGSSLPRQRYTASTLQAVSPTTCVTPSQLHLPGGTNPHAARTGDKESFKHMQVLSNHSRTCQQLFQDPCPLATGICLKYDACPDVEPKRRIRLCCPTAAEGLRTSHAPMCLVTSQPPSVKLPVM